MEWQPDTVASSAQTSILDWLKGSRAVDNDKESIKYKQALIENGRHDVQASAAILD
ncbi:MAG: hypothetical protein M1839_000412 [Geoglossum umbratile]|nr:MAG: hypothetical protein M1839_000412 [Geoglossum umbratile]